jgi:propionyl-CoA synthetase
MDVGYKNSDGYVTVLSRADDVINVAGHRISAGAIEEVLFGLKRAR